jgi:GNAT superfamily N-acetyltransferase
MNAITFRKAGKADMEWVYETFRTTMKSYIEDTWGWDELFQKYGFAENLPPSSLTIAALNSINIGAYSLTEKTDHLWLEMLLILPDYQNQGLGTHILQTIQTEASLKHKPLRLSVLKVNPAREFYRRLGFEVSGEDSWSFKLSWQDRGADGLLC